MEYMSLRRSIKMSLGSTVLVGGEAKVQDSEQRDNGGDGIDVGQASNDGIGGTSCPWRKMGHPPKQQELREQKEQKEQTAVEQREKDEPSEVKSQIYIPPALRHSQGDFNQHAEMESRLLKVPPKMSGKPQAPDLNSAEYFPSLSGANTFRRTK